MVEKQEMSSPGWWKETGTEREKDETMEDGRVTSLRSRVWRRASRCQIYRRVLDGACLRLLISPVALLVPDVHIGQTLPDCRH